MNKYEQYKPSGVEWLGEVPRHWEVIKFKRVIERIKDGTHGTHFRVSEGYPLLSAKNVFNDGIRISENESLISEEEHLEITNNGFPRKDDLLITCVGTIGRSCVYPFDYPISFQRSVAFLRLQKNAIPQFFKYFVEAEIYQAQLFATAKMSAQSGVYMGDLINLMVCLPPLPEQTAIATYLDERTAYIDRLITKQQALSEKLSEKRTALITEAVCGRVKISHCTEICFKDSGIQWLGEIPEHWDVEKTKFHFDFSKGLTITKESLVDDGIPCVNYGEIHSKFGFEVKPEIHDLKCVPSEYLEHSQFALLKKGNFVFADTSEDVKGSGNFTYLNSNIPTFAGYHTIIARLIQNHNSRFLAYVFNSEPFRNQIRTQIKGVKVFSITQAILKNTFVWLPPIEEQIAITTYLDTETAKIDRLQAKIGESVERLKEYRAALITQVVTGKVKVNCA